MDIGTLELTFWDVFIIVAVFVLAYLLVIKMFAKNQASSDRKRGAIQLAGDLRELGLVELAGVLEDFAVDDICGIMYRVRTLHDQMSSDDAKMAFVDEVFRKQLVLRINDTTRRALILRIVEEWRVNNPQVTTTPS